MKLWIAAGGTGGHISPGCAIAEMMADQRHEVIFITLSKNSQYADIQRIRNKQNIQVFEIDAPTLSFHPVKAFRSLRLHFASQKQLSLLYKNHPAKVVLGMGGFPTFPPLYFAKRKKIPILMSEQNAFPGIVTRVFAKAAAKIYLAFPVEKTVGMQKYEQKCLHAGNPLREMFRSQKVTVKGKWPPRRILLVGGSQGSLHMNELYLAIKDSPLLKDIQITISTGHDKFERVKAHARETDTVVPFLEDMASAYLKADLIVARSGSGTLFELVWSRKPAILLPFPFATNDHQRANANVLKESGQAQIIDVRPWNTEQACERFLEILKSNYFDNFLNSAFETEGHILPLNGHSLIVDDILKNYS